MHWEEYLSYGDGEICASDVPPFRDKMGLTSLRMGDTRSLVLETIESASDGKAEVAGWCQIRLCN